MTLQNRRFCFISELITIWWDLFSSYRLKRIYKILFIYLKLALNCAFEFYQVAIFSIMFCYLFNNFCLTIFRLQSGIQNHLYINDNWIGHCMPYKYFINEKKKYWDLNTWITNCSTFLAFCFDYFSDVTNFTFLLNMSLLNNQSTIENLVHNIIDSQQAFSKLWL